MEEKQQIRALLRASKLYDTEDAKMSGFDLF